MLTRLRALSNSALCWTFLFGRKRAQSLAWRRERLLDVREVGGATPASGRSATPRPLLYGHLFPLLGPLYLSNSTVGQGHHLHCWGLQTLPRFASRSLWSPLSQGPSLQISESEKAKAISLWVGQRPLMPGSIGDAWIWRLTLPGSHSCSLERL